MKQSWWNNEKNRAILFQTVLVCFVAAFFWYIASNTFDNLNKRGISTGFSFLSQESGFGIIQSLVAYDESYSFGRTFIVGLLNTLLVSAMGVVFATIIGFIVGVARLSPNWLVAKAASVYIETFRNIPLLLQIFFWYFAVLRALPMPRQSWNLYDAIFLNIRGLYIPAPQFESGFSIVAIVFFITVASAIGLVFWAKRKQELTGKRIATAKISFSLIIIATSITFLATGTPLSFELPVLKGFNFQKGISIIPELTALLIALSVYTAAFIAEAVRSGIEAVDKGQTEAAKALGLHRDKILKLVVVPQAMRVIIPQMTSQYLNLVKNSSLATAIGYPDLVSVFAGTTLNQTGQAIEVIVMTMLVYLTISLTISIFMNWYNNKMMLIEK